MTAESKRILILCTGNSARSQMAEGLLRRDGGSGYKVYSAGTHPSAVNPLAIEAMREVEIDISHNRSMSVNEFTDEEFDYIITVCDNANENCPAFPGHAKRLHWSFDDPAVAVGSKLERLVVFRRVREEIAARLREFIERTKESAL